MLYSWSYADLTTLTFDQIHDEMSRLESALSSIVGKVPHYMRPPYGNYNNLALEVLKMRGYRVILWDIDTVDSIGLYRRPIGGCLQAWF
jgi:peptidoglycan/xylan/chitin deacetylase (PgdA/CDA1 family)